MLWDDATQGWGRLVRDTSRVELYPSCCGLAMFCPAMRVMFSDPEPVQKAYREAHYEVFRRKRADGSERSRRTESCSRDAARVGESEQKVHFSPCSTCAEASEREAWLEELERRGEASEK